MADIKYISKIEIKGLWGKFDFEWNLQPDVNVLSGINGSGKSTVLKCVSTLSEIGRMHAKNTQQLNAIGQYINSCKLSFGDQVYKHFQFVLKADNVGIKKAEETVSNKQPNFHNYVFFGADYTVLASEHLDLFSSEHLPSIDFIDTFDNTIVDSDVAKRMSTRSVKTELDWRISDLQTKYLDYQLNLGRRAFEAINNSSSEDVKKIQDIRDRFLEILDSLFEDTGKKIDRSENKISFLIADETISPYQLSSGEKQLLIILLTALVQDNRNAILFMDEPEISLHIDWQKKLIQYIRELNPNVQIILATHSPAVIMEGWMDKVSNMSDLIKPTNVAAAHGA